MIRAALALAGAAALALAGKAPLAKLLLILHLPGLAAVQTAHYRE